MELTLDQALHKGVEAHKAGRVQEADRLYTAILKAQPKHPDANHNMGVLAVGVGKVQDALPFFKTALEANPSTAQFWLSYIDALIKLGKLADAKAVFDQAKSNGAKGDGFNELEQRLGAVEPTETTAAQDQDLPHDQLQPLINLYSQGQIQEVLDKASQLLQQYPNSVTLYNIQGVANTALGRLDGALDSYNKALSIKPGFSEAYNNMGSTLKAQGKLEEAIAAYNKAVSIKPDYAEAYYNMGIALNEKGKLKEAIDAYSKALYIKSDYAEAYNNMGVTLQSFGKLEKAIDSFNKAIAHKTSYVDAYYNMGVSLQKQGKLEEAIDAYNKAIAIKPDYAKAYNNMGNAVREQGKLEKAIDAYNKAIAIKPDYANAYYNMGIALNEQGKLEEAIEAYSKAIAIKPDYTDARTNLAILLFENRLYEKSTELFAMDSSIRSQSNLLKSFYEQGEKAKFFKQLNYLIERGVNNAVIGSFLSRSEGSFGIKKDNPFCNKPLNYVSQIELNKECDFKKIFVKSASNILRNNEVKHKSQGHLTNGIQTSGNIFTQVGSVTDQWHNIIQAELKKYKDYFCDSEEGFITNWPSDYSIIGWLVSMKSGGELSAHIHDPGWITGSIYINVPPKSKKDSGNLVVTTEDAKPDKGKSENMKSIDVVTGSLVLFPSSLLHYTIPFESDENRIVLAFDVIPK